ncbi:MAG: 3-hydroxyacyl-ACP dehydratase FabZ [Burkholderiales bacterium]
MTLGEFEELLARMPRRYPALLIDRIESCVPGHTARARKCVSVNESFFQGHFPDYPVMPGVLVIESLIQLATFLSLNSGHGAPDAIATLDGARFKRQVIPGDVLALEVTMHPHGKFDVRASVGDEVATEATVVLAWTPPAPDDDEDDEDDA